MEFDSYRNSASSPFLDGFMGWAGAYAAHAFGWWLRHADAPNASVAHTLFLAAFTLGIHACVWNAGKWTLRRIKEHQQRT